MTPSKACQFSPWVEPREWISRLASSGVTMIPSTFDSEALHTAAATLPRATAVNAIEDCTVDGSRVRNSMPDTISGSSQPGASSLTARPIAGNHTKVEASTNMCSRQLPMPWTIASRDSLAPCRKNSSPIATSATTSNTDAARPRAGSSEAIATTTIRLSRKGSTLGTKDGRRMAVPPARARRSGQMQ